MPRPQVRWWCRRESIARLQILGGCCQVESQSTAPVCEAWKGIVFSRRQVGRPLDSQQVDHLRLQVLIVTPGLRPICPFAAKSQRLTHGPSPDVAGIVQGVSKLRHSPGRCCPLGFLLKPSPKAFPVETDPDESAQIATTPPIRAKRASSSMKLCYGIPYLPV